MLSSIFVALLSAVYVASAPYHLWSRGGGSNSSTPSNSTGGINDTVILQFALNLEFLENTFYAQGLSLFNATAFQNAGFPPVIRDRFVQIAEHEATHVALLQAALGPDAPQPCNYTFPITDVASFVSLSFALESAGESAYLGAASLLQNKSVLTTAATILAVEARQASWVSSAALNSTPFNGPFDTPLNTSAVFSLAASFIEACPATNPPLPIVPLNILSLTPANSTIGQNVTVQVSAQQDFSPSNIPIQNTSFVPTTPPALPGNFVAYFHGGQNVTFSLINPDNTTTIPGGLAGVVYASVVTSNQTAPNVNNTLSGLAVLNIPVAPEADNSED